MKFEQVGSILNTVLQETLGKTDIVVEDIRNVVALGQAYDDIIANDAYDKYCQKLINHIGKVVFVNRDYVSRAPSILMDGWQFGSILEKVQCELPDEGETQDWKLTSGQTYNQDEFVAPTVSAKFWNESVTYTIRMSFTQKQVKQSFSSAEQLNGFFSMIESRIRMRKTIDYDNLIMRTINNQIAATMYQAFNTPSNPKSSITDALTSAGSTVKAVNLLYLYKVLNPTSELTVENCLHDLGFLKFASRQIALTSDRMRDASTLFNIGGKTRFTPKDKQHLVLLTDFAKSADVYLQSDTFHNEFTALPKYETISYWQGSGADFEQGSVSDIHVKIKDIFNSSPVVAGLEVHVSGILGCIFDSDACAVCNKEDRTPTHFNAAGEFTNYFYKSDAEYLNDYDENFVVFYIA